MIFIDGVNVDYYRSTYFVFSSSDSTNLMKFTRGEYLVLAYDIEMNGLLQTGSNSPAVNQTVYINGTGEVQDHMILCLIY